MTILILGVLLCIVGTGVILYSEFIMYRVLDEVNNRTAPGEKIGWFFLQLKLEKIFARHEALYPDSSKRRQTNRLALVGIALFALGSFVLIFGSAALADLTR